MSGSPTPPSETEIGPHGAARSADSQQSEGTPTPGGSRNAATRIRLATVSDCAVQLRKLYREARAGTLATSEATKLAYLLNMLTNILTASDLEQRLAQLEAEKARR